MWKPRQGLQVWLCPAHSDPRRGLGLHPSRPRVSVCLGHSPDQSKGGLFLEQRPEGGTQKALCFGVAALKGLLSLNILLQERSPNPDIPEARIPGGFKGAICLVSVPPCFCPVGLRHLSLGLWRVHTHPSPFLPRRFPQHQSQPEGLCHSPVPGEGLCTSNQGVRPLFLHPSLR